VTIITGKVIMVRSIIFIVITFIMLVIIIILIICDYNYMVK